MDRPPCPHPPACCPGVQPSGALHLGNYLGALKNFVALQETHDCFLFVADLHAITQWQDPARLADQTRENRRRLPGRRARSCPGDPVPAVGRAQPCGAGLDPQLRGRGSAGWSG